MTKHDETATTGGGSENDQQVYWNMQKPHIVGQECQRQKCLQTRLTLCVCIFYMYVTYLYIYTLYLSSSGVHESLGHLRAHNQCI